MRKEASWEKKSAFHYANVSLPHGLAPPSKVEEPKQAKEKPLVP